MTDLCHTVGNPVTTWLTAGLANHHDTRHCVHTRDLAHRNLNCISSISHSTCSQWGLLGGPFCFCSSVLICFLSWCLWNLGLCLHAPWISRFVFVVFVGFLHICFDDFCVFTHAKLALKFFEGFHCPCWVTLPNASNLVMVLISCGLGFLSSVWHGGLPVTACHQKK